MNVAQLLPTLSLALALPSLLPAQESAQTPEQTPDYDLVNAFPSQKSFKRPVYLDHHASDPGQYYVVEQAGMIYRITQSGGSKRQVFLDWQEKTLSPSSKPQGHNEEGLLGFAFDVDFANNGFVYIYYSQVTGNKMMKRGKREFKVLTRESVISRLGTEKKDGELKALPDSELVLLKVEQPYGNHNGGTILVGADGMLYIALGDGGWANDPHDHGQDLQTLLATILRVDVRGATAEQPYRIPADNPFVDNKDARGEIWAYGLRNVWRFSFDRETQEMWCGDVGQNLWEEVDRIVKGGNYGWNLMEAKHLFGKTKKADLPKDLIAPVAEYPRKDGLSVTGGYVYRGTKHPELQGQYVYGDFVSGRVWAVREDRQDGKHAVTQLLHRQGLMIASFAQEPDGELLVLAFDGKIYRLVKKAS